MHPFTHRSYTLLAATQRIYGRLTGACVVSPTNNQGQYGYGGQGIRTIASHVIPRPDLPLLRHVCMHTDHSVYAHIIASTAVPASPAPNMPIRPTQTDHESLRFALIRWSLRHTVDYPLSITPYHGQYAITCIESCRSSISHLVL